MKRRVFIKAIAGWALAWPPAAHAQRTSRAARIGYLSFRSPIPADDFFVTALHDLGWVEGKTIVIERRFAAGDIERLKEAAAGLVSVKVDLIVASASIPTRVAKEATASIPIVFVNTGDPVGQGFVQSLARPGGNLTGIAFDAGPDITAKQAQLLLEVLPKISRLAVLWNPGSAFLRSYWEFLKAAAPRLRVSLQPLEARDPGEFERAFDAMTRGGADGLIVLSDTFATFHRAKLAELAARHRLPTVYGHNQYVESGGLMSYGPSFSDAYRRAALYVDKVLKGARPADLPVQQPVRFELAINLKAAKAIGLAIPPALLSRADQVIG